MIPKLVWSFLVLSYVTMLHQVEGCLWGSGCHKRDCSLSSWSKWSSCSQPCGSEGIQIRFRRVTRSAKCGGSCWSLTQTRPCNRVCPNGGTPDHLRCNCKTGYSGRCCTGGKRYYSFSRPSIHSFVYSTNQQPTNQPINQPTKLSNNQLVKLVKLKTHRCDS